MTDEIERNRAILLTAYNNPDATQAEIATACDCPPSEVTATLQQYDGPGEMKAQLRDWNRSLGLDPSAGLNRSQTQSTSPDYATEVTGILTGDQSKQSESVQNAGYTDIIEESIRGFLYLLPWTESSDDDMSRGDAIFWAIIFVAIVGGIVWGVWFSGI